VGVGSRPKKDISDQRVEVDDLLRILADAEIGQHGDAEFAEPVAVPGSTLVIRGDPYFEAELLSDLREHPLHFAVLGRGLVYVVAGDLANALANNDSTKIKVIEQKRDGLGTTHHEAGTLWMGSNASDSTTNLDGRFHHISNAYVASPALFPALGSANPSLTALALARKSAATIVSDSLGAEPGFTPLGSGGLAGWKMAGSGGFIELGGNIIESDGGIGLLWFAGKQFTNFVLRVDWRASAFDDNSGIFIRFPDPGNDWTIPVNQGYEIQIDNTGRNSDANPVTFGDPLYNTGAIYKLAPSTAAPAAGQWHTFEIEANGTTITVRLDGQQVSQLQNANRSPKGFIGLQNHHAGSRVQFTRLRIKELP
jgi:hypothetical protein